MRIYVGRWNLLPKEWDGYNALCEKTQNDILLELRRELDEYEKTHEKEDNFMGVYTPKEFENTFNGDLIGAFNNEKYWIKIF